MGESVTDFWENPSPTSWENPSPTSWENPSPILRKSVTDFGEIRFWEKHTPILGRTGSVFWEEQARFREGLRQSSSLTVLNAKHVWVWMSLKVSQPVGSCKGKLLKPIYTINFDIETKPFWGLR